jgi:uncharacterized protein
VPLNWLCWSLPFYGAASFIDLLSRIFNWNLPAAILGIVAAIPPFEFFIWTVNSNLQICSHYRHLFEFVLRSLFSKWSILQLLVISLIAGISEEAFFRGAIQGSLADRVGAIPALVLASLAFGACHLLTWTYAIVAAFIGAYLGLLWIWTGNLMTPMITHVFYDFLAGVFPEGLSKPFLSVSNSTLICPK